MAFRILNDQSIIAWMWKAHSGRTLLPAFQREWAWKEEWRLQSLVGSILSGLPCGSLLLLEGRRGDFACRELGRIPNEHLEPGDEAAPVEFLLDGQQRLTALLFVFCDYFQLDANWQERVRRVYRPLRNRWFLTVTSEDSSDDFAGKDIFGYQSLNFPSSGLDLLTTEDIQTRCVSRPIGLTTAARDWWHPAHPAAGSDSIVDRCVGNGEIPLFMLPALPGVSESQWLTYRSQSRWRLEQVLEGIARRRIAHLRRPQPSLEDAALLKEMFARAHAEGAPQNESALVDWLVLAWAGGFMASIEGALRRAIPATIAQSEEIGRAVATFEAVNRGGTRLQDFDLLVARAARNPELRDFALQVGGRLTAAMDTAPLTPEVLASPWAPLAMFPDTESGRVPDAYREHFGKALALACHQSSSTAEPDTDHVKSIVILRLSSAQIAQCWTLACEAVNRTLAFLQFRCGVVQFKDVAVNQMLIPLIWLFLEPKAWTPRAVARAEYFFWSARFSDAYANRPTETAIDDSVTLRRWADEPQGAPVPKSFHVRATRVMAQQRFSDRGALLLLGEDEVFNQADFLAEHQAVSPDRDLQLRSGGRAKSVLMDYILSRRPADFPIHAGKPAPTLVPWEIAQANLKVGGGLPLHRHHIVPLATASSLADSSRELRGEATNLLNSPLNLSPCSAAANHRLGAMAPAQYSGEVAGLDKLRHSHFLPSDFDKLPPRQFLLQRFDLIHSALCGELEDLSQV